MSDRQETPPPASPVASPRDAKTMNPTQSPPLCLSECIDIATPVGGPEELAQPILRPLADVPRLRPQPCEAQVDVQIEEVLVSRFALVCAVHMVSVTRGSSACPAGQHSVRSGPDTS